MVLKGSGRSVCVCETGRIERCFPNPKLNLGAIPGVVASICHQLVLSMPTWLYSAAMVFLIEVCGESSGCGKS